MNEPGVFAVARWRRNAVAGCGLCTSHTQSESACSTNKPNGCAQPRRATLIDTRKHGSTHRKREGDEQRLHAVPNEKGQRVVRVRLQRQALLRARARTQGTRMRASVSAAVKQKLSRPIGRISVRAGCGLSTQGSAALTKPPVALTRPVLMVPVSTSCRGSTVRSRARVQPTRRRNRQHIAARARAANGTQRNIQHAMQEQ